jgi:NAD(P)-dependent dehydrogenase (short-subunit alcohol dehydrogenase family)
VGPIDLLVNNAGPPSATDLHFGDGIEAALGSVHGVTESWLATTGSEGGSVVNVASVSGTFVGDGPTAWYVAAKAGIAGYTRHLALTRPRDPRQRCGSGHHRNAADAAFACLARRTIDHCAKPDGACRETVRRVRSDHVPPPPAAGYMNGKVLPVDGGNLIAQ